MSKREMKVFEASIQDGEEIPFALRFNRSDDEFELHEFTAVVPADPTGLALSLAPYMTSDDRGHEGYDLKGIVKFFEMMLPVEDFANFQALLEQMYIPAQMLGETMEWLTKEITGRPTQASLPSREQRRSTGAKSTAKPSSTART